MINYTKTFIVLNLFLLAVWSSTASSLVLLQYHHISDTTPPSTSLSPSLFHQHMEYLNDQGYQVLSLPKVLADLKDGIELPSKSVVITFDDSYDSVYLEAFPILKEKQWPFTIFVTTGALQQKLQGFTSWTQLQEMGRYGATLANHSHSHTHFLRKLDSESQRQWKKRISDDISLAEKLIEENTGQAHAMLAYPYGEYDSDVLDIVRELGFVGFGQQSGPVSKNIDSNDDLLALPRFPFGGTYGSLDDFKTKVATKPMPIKQVVVRGPDGEKLNDPLLPAGVTQPKLTIELDEHLEAAVQCFASGQGAIDIVVKGNQIQTAANKPLPVGRSRYNCTAASKEAGRYYWYSQFFIRKKDNGEWYPEP